MRLRELQQTFWESVRTQPGPPQLERAFVSRGALSAHDRMGIYRTAYWVRQVSALRELFPSVVATLGDDAFARLASHSLRDRPSTSWAIEDLGLRFAPWLAERGGPSGLAAIDWARWAAFTAPDVRTWSRQALFTAGLESLHVVVGPHVQWCAVSSADVVVAAPSLAQTLTAEPEACFCAWRAGFDVLQTLVPRRELDTLEAARAGLSFEEWCTRMADEALPEAERAAALLASVERWLARGWFTEETVS